MDTLQSNELEQRYVSIEEIGHGAFSHVYKAVDSLNDRFVAVKSVKVIDYGDEAQLTACLEHPHVQTVIDRVKTTKYNNPCVEIIVMPLADISLEDAEKTLNSYEILTAFLQIVDALEFAHSHNIIHGNINSANILLYNYYQSRPYLHAKLADFGLSVVSESSILKNDDWRSLLFTLPSSISSTSCEVVEIYKNLYDQIRTYLDQTTAFMYDNSLIDFIEEIRSIHKELSKQNES